MRALSCACYHANQLVASALPRGVHRSSLFSARRGILMDSAADKHPAGSSCDNNTAAKSDTRRLLLLQRLVCRAREAVLAGADEDTTRTSSLGRLRIINMDDTTGLFDVKECSGTRWSPEGAQGRKNIRSHALTIDESITLVCELLAVALKERRGGAVSDFLSPDAAMMLPPLKAVESVVSPLNRQARLWGELQGWHELIVCVAVTFERVVRQSGGEETLRETVRGFLEKLDVLCLSAESKTAGGKRHEKQTPSNTLNDTLPNTLWRLTMICRVMEGLLLYVQSRILTTTTTTTTTATATTTTTTAIRVSPAKESCRGTDAVSKEGTGSSVGPARLEALVRCVLHEMTIRSFAIRDLNRLREPLEGLEALLVRAFHCHCCSPEHDETHPRAFRKELADSLLSFCTAYVKIIPFCLSTPGDSADNGAVAILRVIHQSWMRHQTSVHLQGIRGAFWWLRLVPVVYEGFLHVTAQLHAEQHAGRSGIAHLETARSELAGMLSSMLYFDEGALEERRAALLAHRVIDDAECSKASAGDEESDNPQFGRPRGGRSLFKKDDKNGVLLPRSTDGMQMTSRFSSRRAMLAMGGGSSRSSDFRPGDKALAMMGATANSPLLEIIAASKDAVAQLTDMFDVYVPHRSCALESVWLALLTVHRQVKENGTPAAGVTPLDGARREGSSAQAGLPPFVAASVQYLAATLAAALLRVYELGDPLYTRDGNIRRAVGVAIVAGTQEILLQNRFYLDALVSNWWLRSGATLLLPYGARLSAEVEEKLINLLTQRTRRYEDLNWLKQSTATALSCLIATSLSLVTKQWAGALVLANLRAVAYLLRGGDRNVGSGGSGSGSGGGGGGGLVEPQADELKQLQKWACHVFSSLLDALTADAELLLLCGYASFIDALFELHIRLGTDQLELMQFGDKALLKTTLPALVASLSKSADEDDTETHAAACECALFVLAELSRFASWPGVKISEVLRSDNSLLIRVAVYCLRHARRGGGKRASGYGLPETQLPALEPTHVIKCKSSTIASLLAKGNRCSYLHVLDLSNRLLPFSRVQPLFGGRESGCIAALQHYLEGSRRASSSAGGHKHLAEESVKCLSFMANTPISAHVLGYLVRFIEHYLREQERVSRAPLEGLSTPVAAGGTMERENVMSSLARVEAAPLVLLDYMGHLSCAGSWAMVNWAFNLAETSLRIQRRHQLAATVSVADVATTAILSQLRALSLPQEPRLPHNLLRSIICLSDIMSESPVTLLGFDRGTPMQGLLKHATRGEYRTIFFAMKQAVVLVQQASVKYRRVSTSYRAAASEGAVEEEEGEGGEATRYKEEEEEWTYFADSVVMPSAEEQMQFRVFLDCLVACFDSVLDAIRWCALQQDVLDGELREALVLALQTLFHVLQGCVRAVLQVSSALRERFHAERAQLLVVSLVVAALVGKVVAADYRHVCFTGNIQRSTDSLLGTISELVEECIGSNNDDDNNKAGNCKNRATSGKSSGKVKGEKPLQLVSMLATSLQCILGDPQVSHRIAIRFGLAMRLRTDLTALIMLLRTLAAASALYRPAGSLIQSVWRALCEELVQAKNFYARKRRRVVDESPALLRVLSKEELQLLIESFRDLETEMAETVATRREQGRSADYVVEWTCENASLVLASVTEDPNLLPRGGQRTRDAVTCEGANDNKDVELEDFSLDSYTATPATSSGGNGGGTLVGMDAAAIAVALLEEGENITNVEAVEMLISQCSRVHASSGLFATNDAAIAIPQTAKVILTHFDCLMVVFKRCTLREIMAVPRAEIIFGNLELLFRRRTPVSLEKSRNLWTRLSTMWKEELLLPESALFEQQQNELLQLVRQRRSIVRLGYKDGESSANTSATQLFSPQDNVMMRLALHDVAPIAFDVELSSHDDVSSLLAEERDKKPCGKKKKKKQQQEKQEKQGVPLEVLLTIVGDLSRAPRGDPALEDFARVVIAHVARHHVLLRQRSEGNAVNVMRFLHYREGNSSRVYQRRRLPLECVHAASVAGWFLSAADRQAVTAAIADACGEARAFRSAEHALFEYLRSSCLYLHVLAITANLCHRFRMLGSSDFDGTDAGMGRQRHVRRGPDEEGGEEAPWGGGAPEKRRQQQQQQHMDGQLAERQRIADARQTDVDGVNANLLENILLHFLNVSLVVMQHADSIMHCATSIAVAPGTKDERGRQALLYADELRLMVVVAMQDTLRVLLREAPLGFSLARRVAHRIICSFSCEAIPMTSPSNSSSSSDTRKQGGATSVEAVINTTALELWRSRRPELFLRSPTLLCVLSPSFFNEVLSQHLRSAMSLAVTQVVASLHFYLRRPDAHLAPLMAATTSILSNTFVRNAALRLFCEEFCGQIVGRGSFRDALAPPTVASLQQGAAGSVPNEVLIPFLASISREDVFVTKGALATVLYHSMSSRPDVFGQPPTADRFARFAITKKSSGGGPTPVTSSSHTTSIASTAAGRVVGGRLSLGVSHTNVLLESPLAPSAPAAAAADVVEEEGGGADDGDSDEEHDFPSSAVGDEELEGVALLSRFKADQAEQTATLTHKRALASLNLTLAEVMETGMHFAAMRRLTGEEYKKARAMIHSADDARHERIAAFRSACPPTVLQTSDNVGSPLADSALGHPDAALQIEEPMHFGVVLLHVRFALRKIIHASMRRLAAQQGPKTLSMMVEMLREIDPKWHRGRNEEHRRQSDGMLAGTLRVLVARSLVCAELAGDAGDNIGGGAGGIAISAVGLQRTDQALYLTQRYKHNNRNDRNTGSPRREHRRSSVAQSSFAARRSAG